MADRVRWGVLATGSIARQFAEGLRVSRTGALAAVASRSGAKADAFAAEFSPEGTSAKAYDSVEALLADPGVDAVYIASPHHVHRDHTIAAARAGRAILCEKPFVLNAREAEEALAAVAEAGVFFMEAFMYRCSPQILKLREILASGAIGTPRAVNAEFSFGAGRGWENFRTEASVGGGGLLDVGGYCVSLALLVFGGEPTEAFYAKAMDEAGYDGVGVGALKYATKNGGSGLAHFGAGIHLNMRNDARIYGEEGHITLTSPWKSDPDAALIVTPAAGTPESHHLGLGNAELYAAEADAVAQYLEAKECPHFTIEETRIQVRTLDRLRASAGLVFDADKP